MSDWKLLEEALAELEAIPPHRRTQLIEKSIADARFALGLREQGFFTVERSAEVRAMAQEARAQLPRAGLRLIRGGKDDGTDAEG